MTDAKPNQTRAAHPLPYLHGHIEPTEIAFDRTELVYYSRTMTTSSNHTPRRQPQYARHANCRARHPARPTVIPPPIAARPERRCQTRRHQDSTECDRIRRDATKARARAHARQRATLLDPHRQQDSCPRAREATIGGGLLNAEMILVPARTRGNHPTGLARLQDEAKAHSCPRAREATPQWSVSRYHRLSCPRAREATENSTPTPWKTRLVPARTRGNGVPFPYRRHSRRASSFPRRRESIAPRRIGRIAWNCRPLAAVMSINQTEGPPLFSSIIVDKVLGGVT